MELTQNFLYELFLLFFRKRGILDICVKYLKYEYLPTEPYKKIWKYVKEFYLTNNKVPSVGMVSQQFLTDKDSNDINTILTKINESKLIDEEDAFYQLEEYIKDVMSQEFYDGFHDFYIEGKKEDARVYMREMSEKISDFSIKSSTNYYSKVFGDFGNRNRERVLNRNKGVIKQKVPYSIDELDDVTNGGIGRGETSCILARSGSGKTKFLRWQGIGAIRRGMRVLHIQAEGSKQACLDGYDATWTAILMNDLKDGSIPYDRYSELENVVKGIVAKKADIYVHAFEQFSSGSMSDVRLMASDCVKYYGDLDLIIIDYLERLEPGDGLKYSKGSYEGEKMRRSVIADKMSNLSLEFNVAVSTATQATDIPPELLNKEDWVMTRHNVSMAKNLPESFSYFLTANQTNDERKKGIMRIYTDKIRYYEGEKIIKIYQSYAFDRFYDRQLTIKEFYKK